LASLGLLDAAGPAIRLGFTLEQWCVWQSWETPADYRWPRGEVLSCGGGGADVGFLPMMQRRRLSPLARAAVAVAWRCRQGQADMPTVFFSRHGESRHYFEMLDGLAAGEEVSPSRFSLSVHNAVAGLCSLANASFAPYLSLAGGDEGLFAAFLEAHGWLAENACPQVLVVCYEQPLPEAYRAYTASLVGTWALAMRLGRAGGDGPRLKLARTPAVGAAPQADADLRLSQSMLAGLRQSECRLERCVWRWSLDHA